MDDMTRFQFDILTVLAGADGLKGLAVKAELEAEYGTEVNHGRLYPNLDTLVDRGMVDKSQRDQRTNEYRLTARGRRELEARFQFVHDHVTREHVIEHGSGGDLTFRPRD